MSNKNLLIENKKPIETVQEIEKTWEQEIEEIEREVAEKIAIDQRTDEQGFYVAETVENGVDNSTNNLALQPTTPERPNFTDPATNKPAFYFELELRKFYITNAGSLWTRFLPHEQAREIIFEEVEEAEDFLENLQAGNIRIAKSPNGANTYRGKELEKDLKAKLEHCLQLHKNGEAVVTFYKEPYNVGSLNNHNE